MKKRSKQKQESLQRILKSGGTLIRTEGVSGSAISSVMKDAGLTHGAFYSHFRNKNELLSAALEYALAENRARWITREDRESWPTRLTRLAGRYLTASHRDDLSASCALAALVCEIARTDEELRQTYESELLKSIEAVCGERPCDADVAPERFDESIMLLALCIGGINISRAVKSEDLSDLILEACRRGAERIPGSSHPDSGTDTRNSRTDGVWSAPLTIEQYPFMTFEKLRYGDTDRQGHVNNAVFSTMLETGRVEILYDPEIQLAAPGCAFVIVSQNLNYHKELNWPGRVEIGTRVTKIGKSSITFEQAIFQREEMHASATTVIVQMNETTRRSEPLAEKTVNYFSRLIS